MLGNTGFDNTGFNGGKHFGTHTQISAFNHTGNIDPFNYPMPGRKDLMSLSTIDFGRDNMKTTTRKFASRRFESTNLTTADIHGNVYNLIKR